MKTHFKGIIDTTLRDGQQSPYLYDTCKYRFSLEEKKMLVEGLIQLGIQYIEFFAPTVSDSEKEDFVEIKRFIKSITRKKMHLLAHCRCNEDDIEKAVALGFDGLNLYMGVTKYAQKYNYKLDFGQVLYKIKYTVEKTRKRYPHLYIRFSLEDSFRTPLEDIFTVADQIHMFVDTFGLPDTVGIAYPTLVAERVGKVKSRYPKVNLECHFHNDRGLSLINAITAIQNGVEFVDASVWGLAERSGITSITALLFNLFFIDSTLCEPYQLDVSYPLNVLMGAILNTQVPFTEPVSLTNRTHTAGVHQKAVLNHAKAYEAHSLDRFGVSKNQILLGPLTGWNLIYYYLKEVSGYTITVEQAKLITAEYKRRVHQLNHTFHPEKLLEEVANDYNMVKIVIPKVFEQKRIENL